MQPLLYLLKRSLINSLKELPKRPLALVAYVFVAILLILILVMVFLLPSGLLHRGSAEAFSALALMSVLVVVYFGIRQGITSGSSFFRLADVNLVFTAPILPRQVLVYGFIQQFFRTLLVVLFLMIQIPNLRNYFAIGPAGVLVLLLGVVLLLFSMQLIGMLVYSVSSRSARIRHDLETGLNILVGLFLAGFVAVLLEKKDFMQAALAYLNSRAFDCLPLIGWFKVMLTAAVRGTDAAFFINLALVLVSVAVMILFLYMLKTDYYEDVLAATEYWEQLRQAKREGKAVWQLRSARVKKVAYTPTGTGAAAILQRHILEYRKTGWFFVDKNSLIIIVIGIASKYLFHYSINAVLYLTVYLLFFFSMQGKWAQELGKPFIYLIPASSAAKVFYATLAEILKDGVDGLLLFASAGFMFKSDVTTVCLCALVYMTFGAVYTYGDILSRKLFGQTHSRNLAVFMKMFLLLFVIAPGAIIAAVCGFFFGFADLFYLALIVYNVLASALMLIATRGIFEELELS